VTIAFASMRSADEHDPESAGEPAPAITPAMFAEWRAPRLGASNPERLTNPVWEWLVRSEHSAYSASRHFGLASDVCREPGWSFARFGRSTTMLEDGRTVLIAGEHEDAYDADFFIYNDVVVTQPEGSIEIFGYPRDVFPPTDFHSATLLGDRIVIVGNLSYPANRIPGSTQVLLVDLDSFATTLVRTSGESPGWIHRHSAELTDGAQAIVIRGGLVDTGDGPYAEFRDNGDDWRLDLPSWRWERMTNRHWRQWQFARVDKRPNHLWRLRSQLQLRGVRWASEHRERMQAMLAEEAGALKAAYGAEPDLGLFATLFVPPVEHESRAPADDEFGTHRIGIDGVVVRYVEKQTSVKLVVEGILPERTLSALVTDLREKLSALERTAYEVRES
jgi:hypothetical protein